MAALALEHPDEGALEGAVHQAVQHGVLRRVGVAQQHGERVQRDQGVAPGGVKVQAEVDDVVGQPARGEQHGQDDHHQCQAASRQHLPQIDKDSRIRHNGKFRGFDTMNQCAIIVYTSTNGSVKHLHELRD